MVVASGEAQRALSGGWRVTMRRNVARRRIHVVVIVLDESAECISTLEKTNKWREKEMNHETVPLYRMRT